MKAKLLDYLYAQLWNRRIKILFGPKGSDKESFLNGSFVPLIKQREPGLNVVVIDWRDGRAADYVSAAIDGGKRVVFIIENIYLGKKTDAVTNSFMAMADSASSSPSVDIVATSNSMLSQDLTEIRGRFMKIFYPGTLFEDYLVGHPDASVYAFLFDPSLDEGIVNAPMWLDQTQNQRMVKEILLKNVGECLTNQMVRRLIRKQFGASLATHSVIDAVDYLHNNCFFYFLPRFDLKKGRPLESGLFAYPITNRMIDGYEYAAPVEKRAESALVSKWFYDGYQVYKACHSAQKMRHGIKTFSVEYDGFFLISPDERRLVYFTEELNAEAESKIKRAPSSAPKTIIVSDALTPRRRLDSGIEVISLEHMLKEGFE